MSEVRFVLDLLGVLEWIAVAFLLAAPVCVALLIVTFLLGFEGAPVAFMWAAAISAWICIGAELVRVLVRLYAKRRFGVEL